MGNDVDISSERFAVRDVMLSYAAGVDERDFEMYGGCFADNVEVVGFGDQVVNGAKAWVDYVKNALEAFGATQHMLGPPKIKIDGDTASCRTDVQAWHQLVEPEGATLTLWATYNSNMVKQDGQWKIVRHELVSRATRRDVPGG